MLITAGEEPSKKSDGADLPMFSRAGKSTVSQYLVFNKAAHKKHDYGGVSDDEDDAVETLLGEKKPPNLELEMKKIQDAEYDIKKKQKHSRFSQKVQAANRKLGHFFVPFDMLADKEHRRVVSSSFNATSREAW